MSDRKRIVNACRRMLWLAVLLTCGCPVLAQPSLPDPTRPARTFSPAALSKTEAPRRWRLTSTLVGADRRVAVINGQVVAVGQRVAGALLEQVEPGRVRLRQGKNVIRLQVQAASVKAPVGQPQP